MLVGLICLIGLGGFALLSRRMELRRMQRTMQKREQAVRQGSDQAQLMHPVIDLTRCLGCGTCVSACPEEGVLDLLHGQATVVNGARCVGHSHCERSCPVDAITVTVANLAERKDVPAVTAELEAVGSPGLFLAGEVTAHALIKTAIEHGTAVAAEVARRNEHADDLQERTAGVLDLCIVGAGPAGLACSLEAKRHGLDFVTLEQEQGPGGTVAKYPRRKLVMTQPVELPLYGRMKAASYTKETLVDLWQRIAKEQQLPIQGGEVLQSLERDEEGNYLVGASTGTYTARNVCLALGRRGTPRKLSVPGEDLSKVIYSLQDANSYQGRRILVVGGGDSAIEAALGLAEQKGNHVTISYRKDSFFRMRASNEQRLQASVSEGRVHVVFNSQVKAIHPDRVELQVQGSASSDSNQPGAGSSKSAPVATKVSPGKTRTLTLPNDEVFIMVGGVPPFALLEAAGVSFDPALREAPEGIWTKGTGLTKALAMGLGLSFMVLCWVLWHADYYFLSEVERAAHPKHGLLRPGFSVGFGLGLASVALILVNLAYLLRRSPNVRFNFGSLKLWMTSHVATGVLALLCAMLHGAMAPKDTPGGHAFWALTVLFVTGAIGRYFYAYVPRAANGRELELAEVKSRLGRVSEEWDQKQQQFGERVRNEVESLAAKQQWQGSFFGRVFGLLGIKRGLKPLLQELAEEGREHGIAEDQIQETLGLAHRAYRTAITIAHFEDLRGILNTWRYLHRWVAVLLVVLIVVHIVHAWVYGALLFGGGG